MPSSQNTLSFRLFNWNLSTKSSFYRTNIWGVIKKFWDKILTRVENIDIIHNIIAHFLKK